MNLIYNIFLYAMWFLATYYVVLILLILYLGKDKLYERKKFDFSKRPFVSIIVPAYNEEGKVHHRLPEEGKIRQDRIHSG